MRWRFDIATDIGARPEQQDRAAAFAVPGRADDRLVVLADGMGGHSDGGLAAQAVIDTARQAVADTPVDHPQRFLGDLCRRAHAAIDAVGKQRDSNPASTCVLLYLGADEAYWAHVGDSRLYHFQGDALLSHTRDHTLGELLRDAPDPAPGRRRGDNRLYMCLGGQNDLNPEFGASAVGANDWFLLCSDGLWSQADVAGAVARRGAMHADGDMAAELVTRARKRGGQHSDNISLVLVRPQGSPLRQAWRRIRHLAG